MKPRSERDKRYEEKHKNERKAKNVVWGTSIPRETAEEVDAFLKKHGYTKVKLIEEGYKSLMEQAGEINIIGVRRIIFDLSGMSRKVCKFFGLD